MTRQLFERPPVSALIGLNATLPSSLTQISVPEPRGDRDTGSRRAISASAIARAAIRPRAVGLAEADAIAFGVPNDAGLDDLGREIGQRSDDAARLDGRRDDAAGIDAFEPQPVELAADALEIPPRDAVLRADDDGVGTEQRRKLRRERRQAVRLDAEDDDVRVADRAQIAGDRRAHLEIAVGADDPQAALLHRAQVRAAREQHDVGAGAGEPRADVARRWRPRPR